MIFYLLAISFPEWRPHFAFLDTPHANEMMALRWAASGLWNDLDWAALLFQPGADAGDEKNAIPSCESKSIRS